ncbi:hypothetical protein PMAYCL1PPCAC_30057, partial [Pristionchus mayeri]
VHASVYEWFALTSSSIKDQPGQEGISISFNSIANTRIGTTQTAHRGCSIRPQMAEVTDWTGWSTRQTMNWLLYLHEWISKGTRVDEDGTDCNALLLRTEVVLISSQTCISEWLALLGNGVK